MQKKQDTYGIVWFTTNLRVQDNTALYESLHNHDRVVGVYCFDPRQFALNAYGFKKTEVFRAKFLIESVINLRNRLEEFNIPLFIYHDTPENRIPDLVKTLNAQSIYYQKEWTQEEHDVQKDLVARLPKTVAIKSYFDQFLFHPDDIGIPIPDIPNVFTNFRKHVEHNVFVRNVLPIPAKHNCNVPNTTAIPTLKDFGFEDFEPHPHTAFPFKGGEDQALERVQSYFYESKKLGIYKKTRNGLLGTDYSSKLSPWLALGCISARTVFWAVKDFEKTNFKNESTYWLFFELIWRDYFKYVSLKHGNAFFKLGGILNKDYEWNRDWDLINSWIQGTTQAPFVNANMIELKKTGWMSNRGRQNVASYFAKTLELDWRIGAAYFESLLIDYDVHSNYGNWMYVAGVGNDPRDRKFNVRLQAERYDPQGHYQRLWLQNTLF